MAGGAIEDKKKDKDYTSGCSSSHCVSLDPCVYFSCRNLHECECSEVGGAMRRRWKIYAWGVTGLFLLQCGIREEFQQMEKRQIVIGRQTVISSM